MAASFDTDMLHALHEPMNGRGREQIPFRQPMKIGRYPWEPNFGRRGSWVLGLVDSVTAA